MPFPDPIDDSAATFDDVPLLSREDPVDAGENGEGAANLQAKALANRTQNLKVTQENQGQQLQDLAPKVGTILVDGTWDMIPLVEAAEPFPEYDQAVISEIISDSEHRVTPVAPLVDGGGLFMGKAASRGVTPIQGVSWFKYVMHTPDPSDNLQAVIMFVGPEGASIQELVGILNTQDPTKNIAYFQIIPGQGAIAGAALSLGEPANYPPTPLGSGTPLQPGDRVYVGYDWDTQQFLVSLNDLDPVILGPFDHTLASDYSIIAAPAFGTPTPSLEAGHLTFDFGSEDGERQPFQSQGDAEAPETAADGKVFEIINNGSTYNGSSAAPGDLVVFKDETQNIAVFPKTVLARSVSIAPITGLTASNVQTALQGLLPKSGGSLSGDLILAGDPLEAESASTRLYVDKKTIELLKYPPKEVHSSTPAPYLSTRSATPLSGTQVALVTSATPSRLVTADFDPETSTLTQVGNALDFPSSITIRICPLVKGTDQIALFRADTSFLHTYDFDGTDWVGTGTPLEITLEQSLSVRLCNVAPNRIALVEGYRNIQTYDWDGLTWVPVGEPMSTGMDMLLSVVPSETENEIIALIQGLNKKYFVAYSFAGEEWASIEGSEYYGLSDHVTSSAQLVPAHMLYGYDEGTARFALIDPFNLAKLMVYNRFGRRIEELTATNPNVSSMSPEASFIVVTNNRNTLNLGYLPGSTNAGFRILEWTDFFSLLRAKAVASPYHGTLKELYEPTFDIEPGNPVMYGHGGRLQANSPTNPQDLVNKAYYDNHLTESKLVGAFEPQQGTGYSLEGSTGHTKFASAMGSNRLAVISGGNLMTLEWVFDSRWQIVGTPTDLGLSFIGHINEVHSLRSSFPHAVAVFDRSRGEVRRYEFLSSTWVLTGNPLPLSASQHNSICAHGVNRILVAEGNLNQVTQYEWNGTDWVSSNVYSDISPTGSFLYASLSYLGYRSGQETSVFSYYLSSGTGVYLSVLRNHAPVNFKTHHFPEMSTGHIPIVAAAQVTSTSAPRFFIRSSHNEWRLYSINTTTLALTSIGGNMEIPSAYLIPITPSWVTFMSLAPALTPAFTVIDGQGQIGGLITVGETSPGLRSQLPSVEPTPDSLPKRDSSGRLQAEAPIGEKDVVNLESLKEYKSPEYLDRRSSLYLTKMEGVPDSDFEGLLDGITPIGPNLEDTDLSHGSANPVLFTSRLLSDSPNPALGPVAYSAYELVGDNWSKLTGDLQIGNAKKYGAAVSVLSYGAEHHLAIAYRENENYVLAKYTAAVASGEVSWSLVGQPLVVSTTQSASQNISLSLEALSQDTVVLIASTGAVTSTILRAYTFDGTNWVLQDTVSPSLSLRPTLKSLDSSHFIMKTREALQAAVYRFSGGTLTALGSLQVTDTMHSLGNFTLHGDLLVYFDKQAGVSSTFRINPDMSILPAPVGVQTEIEYDSGFLGAHFLPSGKTTHLPDGGFLFLSEGNTGYFEVTNRGLVPGGIWRVKDDLTGAELANTAPIEISGPTALLPSHNRRTLYAPASATVILDDTLPAGFVCGVLRLTDDPVATDKGTTTLEGPDGNANYRIVTRGTYMALEKLATGLWAVSGNVEVVV